LLGSHVPSGEPTLANDWTNRQLVSKWSEVMGQLGGILNAIVEWLLLTSGLPSIPVTNPAFQVMRAGVLSTITLIFLILWQIVSRITIIRALWDKKAQIEGYWIEKIKRRDSVFITIVRIRRRMLFDRRYTIYGEALDFAVGDGSDFKIHASFKSNSLHFSNDTNLVLIFNYTATTRSTNAVSAGLAEYTFDDFDMSRGHGWFVSVIDGANHVIADKEKDSFDLEKLKISDWLFVAFKNRRLISTIFTWRRHLAQQAYSVIIQRQDLAQIKDGKNAAK
jgi:hypothetical protein